MDQPYEEGGMYIILTTIDAATDRYHWGIYVCVSDAFGMVYHVTNAHGRWAFEELMTEDIHSSRSIVAALQIGRGVTNDAADAAHGVFCSLPVIADGSHDASCGENFTCRVWVLEAVHRLRQRGLVPDEEAREVEDEVFRLARSATSHGVRRLRRSRGLRDQEP